MATRKWIPIAVGIVIFVVIVGVGLIGGLAYFVSQQVSVKTVSSENGEQEFEKEMARFAGQRAFIELPAHGESDARAVVHREMETGRGGSLTTIHLRVWSPDERKLVRLDLPFWMVRMMGSKPLKLHTEDESFGSVSIGVTAEEIERRGPGLILNQAGRRGEKILVWTE